MKKYINFEKHPAFKPMWNPMDMLNAGIHGGQALAKLGVPIGALKSLFPKLQLVKKALVNKTYDIKANYFCVKVDYSETEFNPFNFIKWYIDFYHNHLQEGRPMQKDKMMMGLWNARLWEIWDQILSTEDPLTKECIVTDNQKQALLEIAWNWQFKPNFDKQWMHDQLPLTPLVPPTLKQ